MPRIGTQGVSGFSIPAPFTAEEGTVLTLRPTINFIGPDVTAADNSANNRTDVTITGASVTTGWVDDGLVVRLNTTTDRVSIGDTTGSATYKLSVFGDAGESGVGVQANAATESAIAAFLSGDTNPRFRVGNGTNLFAIEFGPGNAATDWALARNGANRADLGSNDELCANGTGFFSVRAAASDTNPTAALDTTRLRLGLNNADNLSWSLSVATATNRAELGSGDFLDVIATGRFEHRTLASDSQPTVSLGASGLLLGPGTSTAVDLRLDRSAAVTLRIDDNAGGAATVVGGADNMLTVGTAATRLAAVNAVIHRVYAAASDANASATLQTTAVLLGVGGGTTLDARIFRSAATTIRLDDGAAGALTILPGADAVGTFGSSAARWATFVCNSFQVYPSASAANRSAQISDNAVQLGAGGATVLQVRLQGATTGTLVIDNTAGGAAAVVGAADNLLTLGTAARRCPAVNAIIHNVHAAASDANPSAQLATTALLLGVGGGTALDARVQRTAAATITIDNASGAVCTVLPIEGADFGSTTARWDVYSREHIVNVTHTGADADYTVVAGDYLVAFSTALTAVRACNLPAVSANRGRVLVIKNDQTAAFNVNVLPNGADTIDGLTGYLIASRQWVALTAPETGASWIVGL